MGRSELRLKFKIPIALHVIAIGWAAILVLSPPVPPPARSETLVGEWRGDDVRFTVDADGWVHYRAKKGGWRSRINLPARAWSDDGVTLGLWPVEIDFALGGPGIEGDERVLIVDGDRLLAVSGG